ncbi:uncharacterized protein LOC135092378 isoform X2 [Scylla paramamosain]|uniref:uncharacterized protein LOC135092378 isoform X2 n=1 Tax=Scylla paramamosain TaxID=85552 RepID=UPI003082F9CF
MPRAFVVLEPEAPVQPEVLKRFVNDRVPDFKQLTGGVWVVEEIPKKQHWQTSEATTQGWSSYTTGILLLITTHYLCFCGTKSEGDLHPELQVTQTQLPGLKSL